MDFEEGGVEINEIHHDIKLVCTCDWKASSCIEGFEYIFYKYANETYTFL